jgi:hypothetical protein
VAGIEALQLLLDFETTSRAVLYEQETAHTLRPDKSSHSVERSTISVCGVKATRSVARLDLIVFQPFTRNEY